MFGTWDLGVGRGWDAVSLSVDETVEGGYLRSCFLQLICRRPNIVVDDVHLAEVACKPLPSRVKTRIRNGSAVGFQYTVHESCQD